MQEILFYIFSALTLLCGLLVVFNPFSRNPVTSAMFLVLTIISMSGLFVLLKAFFLAAVQILVYAGAVIVLFLFVIMLLDVKEEERRRYQKFGTFLGFAAVMYGSVSVVDAHAQCGAHALRVRTALRAAMVSGVGPVVIGAAITLLVGSGLVDVLVFVPEKRNKEEEEERKPRRNSGCVVA